MERLADDLAELETTLGDRLSDDTREQITRVRASLSQLVAFTNGIDEGSIAVTDRVRAEFQELAHNLRADLNGLKHEVQDDLHGIAKNGGGLAMASIQHDLKLVKYDVDLIIRDEQRDLKIALRHGNRDDKDDVQPTTVAGTPTVATSSTAVSTPVSGTPTPITQISRESDDDHESGLRSSRRDDDGIDDKNRGRGRALGVPPILVIPGLALPVVPATSFVQPSSRPESESPGSKDRERGNQANHASERGAERATSNSAASQQSAVSNKPAVAPAAPRQEVKSEAKPQAPRQEAQKAAPSAKAEAPKAAESSRGNSGSGNSPGNGGGNSSGNGAGKSNK